MEPSHDDGFKWFGEGFDEFPKILPDDTVEYAIYIIDKSLSQQRVSARLKEVSHDANELSKEPLKDYIWQRDAFSLQLKLQDGRWALLGRTNYGDSVADEWLVVFLLRSLSLRNPDIWVRVYDTDGEFLLIEAANALPRWIRPEIAANRVWLHGGSLRLIPRQASRALESRAPTLKEAIAYIEERQETMVRSPMIEAEAFYRLNRFPKAIEEQFHHSIITVPRKVAFLLKQKPAYIAPAIEAFYLRDPISMKPLQSLDTSSLKVPPAELIDVSVRFPRVGFAQIRSQEFPAPECWSTVIEDHALSAQARLRLDTGMKLTSGFEMLLNDAKSVDQSSVRAMQILLDDLEHGDEVLPDDSALKQWNDRDDDESWMNIDFNEFDKELSGKKSTTDEAFGDKDAQEQLRKMVSRFEDFLNDDRAGLDGADLAEDEDSDDFDTDESDDELVYEDEDREVSFDDVEFARAMREMMGLPSEKNKTQLTRHDDDTQDDTKAIELISDQIEDELRSTGVLDISTNRKDKQGTIMNARASSEATQVRSGVQTSNADDDGVDIDFQLAQNMLEAFKSQGGMAGPAGNLMGLLGVKMPPDQDK